MDELQNIQNLIYVIRGQRVMLDRDLAKAYGVETKALDQAVKVISNASKAMITCSNSQKKNV
jgi:hypothetical protein